VDASFLGNELVGEMWVNRTVLATYAYAGTGTAPAVLQPWVDKVTAALPGVAAHKPKVVIGAGNTVTITIYWQHPEEANQTPTPPPHQYLVVTSIN
jgi:hypothetical protein